MDASEARYSLSVLPSFTQSQSAMSLV